MSLAEDLRNAGDECSASAAELEDRLKSDQRWRDLGSWLVDLVKEHGPAIVHGLMGIAVARALDSIKAE